MRTYHIVPFCFIGEDMSYKKQLTSKDKNKINYRNKKDPAYLQLTPMQERFCYEYIVDRNQLQAAIRSGFSPKTSYAQASKMFKNPYVQYRINRLIEEQNSKIEVNAANVLKEIKKLAFFDIQDVFNEDGSMKAIKDMPEVIRKAIAFVEVEEKFSGKGSKKKKTGNVVKVKFWPKDKFIELLSKYTKLVGEENNSPRAILVFGDINIEDIQKKDAPSLLGDINNRLAQQYQKQ